MNQELAGAPPETVTIFMSIFHGSALDRTVRLDRNKEQTT